MSSGRPPLRTSPRAPGERLRYRARAAFVAFWTERITAMLAVLQQKPWEDHDPD